MFIADDHPIFRRGLCDVIACEEDLCLVGQATNGEQALLEIRRLQPAVAVLDVNMPGLSGLETGRRLAAEQAATQVVLLTMHEDEELFNSAMDAGFRAYLLKENAVEDLVGAIHAVADGQTFISPSVSGYLLRRSQSRQKLLAEKPGLDLLTWTERRILRLISDDNTSKEIAAALGISVRTVETHRQNMSHKLHLSGVHSLVKFAFNNKSRL